MSFNILVTGMGVAPNIAQVEEDTVTLYSNEFVYAMPDNKDCELGVTFYKDFVYVKYTKGNCEGKFGMNTGVDGIYIKK